MASTRVRGAGPPDQGPKSGLVPERMDFVGEWFTDDGEKIELWTDDHAGNGHLVLAAHRREHLATLYYAGGVTRATVWHGSSNDRPALWRDAQKMRAAAAIAAEHAGGPGSFYESVCAT